MMSAMAAAPRPAATGPLRCVIVEDQSMFLELLAAMIRIHGGTRIVAQARDVASGCAACEEQRPDVLILDLALPDGDGLEVARRFIECHPAGRVIVVSGQASEFVCPDWLNDTIQAVISKNDAFESLRRELDELTGIAPRGAEKETDDFSAKPLTEREAEVFRLIGDGLSTRAIAEVLGLSEHTIQTHRKRMAAKMGTSGDELTRRAIAHQAMFSATDRRR
ncbi:MAG: response regulator transcription factor [Pirellulales bacterium]